MRMTSPSSELDTAVLAAPVAASVPAAGVGRGARDAQVPLLDLAAAALPAALGPLAGLACGARGGDPRTRLQVVRFPVRVVPAAHLAGPRAGVPQAAWLDLDGTAWIGRGAAATWSAGDVAAEAGRVHADAAALLDACQAALAAAEGDATGLRAFGALAFDPESLMDPLGGDVPAARFVLPRWLLRIPADAVALGGDAEAWIVVTEPQAGEREAFEAWAGTPVAPTPVPATRAVPDPTAADHYQGIVQAGIDAIATGRLAKVVLARPSYLEAASHLPVWTIFWALAAQAPGTARFALAAADGTAFLGASPERLVVLEGDHLIADILAGTAARGETPAIDAARAEGLRGSSKDAHEHAVVREAVLAALAPLTSELAAPETPRLLGLPNVWHLHTPATGRLAPGKGLADVVRALHPTPAVGGAPQADARALIRQLEATGRGFYAGPVGWVSADSAHLAVGIRSAHIRGNRAAAIAGAGIVAGSDPVAEYQETERKLAPMIAALTAGGAA